MCSLTPYLRAPRDNIIKLLPWRILVKRLAFGSTFNWFFIPIRSLIYVVCILFSYSPPPPPTPDWPLCWWWLPCPGATPDRAAVLVGSSPAPKPASFAAIQRSRAHIRDATCPKKSSPTPAPASFAATHRSRSLNRDANCPKSPSPAPSPASFAAKHRSRSLLDMQLVLKIHYQLQHRVRLLPNKGQGHILNMQLVLKKSLPAPAPASFAVKHN